MKSREASPPRWAEGMLQCLLRPCDRDSAAGDLLEEYRAAREPALGPLRADVWYIKQVLSVLWRQIWPGALILAAQSVLLALTVFRPGHHAPNPSPMVHSTFAAVAVQIALYGSIVGAPGISILDAAIYFFTAYRGVQRTGLIKTGILLGGAISLVGFGVLFAAAAIVTPSLALALVANPPLLLILSAYLAIPLAFSACIGALAGMIVRWRNPQADRIVRSS